jgi:hypothetical protein
MTLHPMTGDEPSREARYIFNYLKHHGGSVRTRQLQRFGGLERDALIEALFELHERYWVIFNRRKTPGASPADDWQAPIDRVTITRFSRRKNRGARPAAYPRYFFGARPGRGGSDLM